MKAEVNSLQRCVTRRLYEWRKDEWRATLESLDPEDQSLCSMTIWVMRVYTPSPPCPTGNQSLSDSEKAKVLANNEETQFQTVTDLSVPVVLEMVDVALTS